MKKIILLSAVLLGAAVTSQAGVHVAIGIGFQFPYAQPVIVSQPAPVIVQMPVCVPAPIYVAPRYCEPAPRVVYVPQPRYYSYPSCGYGYSNRGNQGGHRR